MKIISDLKTFVALIGTVCVLAGAGCFFNSAASTAMPTESGAPGGEKQSTFPVIDLPVPTDKADLEYLGLSGSGTFTIADIQATVVIVEVFTMYCPHCQKEAPQINRLYEMIQEDPDLRNSMKLIGIGVGNTPLEVTLFKDKYGVPFPLFPDQDMSISGMLGVRGTPTFIGIKVDPDGTCRDFYFKSGSIGEVKEFLHTMISLSNTGKE